MNKNKSVDISNVKKTFEELCKSGNFNGGLYESIMRDIAIHSTFRALEKLVRELVGNDYKVFMDYGEHFGGDEVKFRLYKEGESKDMVAGEFAVVIRGGSGIKNHKNYKKKGEDSLVHSHIELTQKFIDFLMNNTKKEEREIIQNIIDSIKKEGLNEINDKKEYIEKKYGMELEDFSVFEDEPFENIKNSRGGFLIAPGIIIPIEGEVGARIDIDINGFIPEKVNNLFREKLREFYNLRI